MTEKKQTDEREKRWEEDGERGREREREREKERDPTDGRFGEASAMQFM